MTDLVIVGSGAAGTALFVHLMAGPDSRIRRVRLVDPSPPAHGLAFDRPERYVLCNTSVAVNSVFPHRPGHFGAWLTTHGAACRRWRVTPADVAPDGFVPRGLFREYLAAEFRTALDTALARGIEVEHVPDHVTDIAGGGTGLVLRTRSGRTLAAEYVAIGTGLVPATASMSAPARLRRTAAALREDDGFLPDRPRVIVLGARQSALDAALVVARARPDAELVLVSRTGVLPSVRIEMTERPGRFFTSRVLMATLELPPGEMIGQWRRLLLAEAAATGAQPPRWRRPRPGLCGLADDLARTRAGDRVAERIDRNAITVVNDVWPFLPGRHRRAAPAAFGPLVRRYVSAVPARSAERMLGLRDRLTVTAGPRDWHVRDGKVAFTDHRGRVVTGDRVVDATGFTPAVSPRVLGRPVNELARLVEPGTCHVPAGPGTGLFLVGPPLGSARAVTNYFNATARQAASVAGFLAAEPAGTSTGGRRHG
ncbi:FAD/NAD(P)-binding protein [Amycolatopsis sp. H6(2020)]|nr:FAD/NAD(P)-binding protein [Amycolatopsis sp. H6(2020)]